MGEQGEKWRKKTTQCFDLVMENADPNIIVHANPGQGNGNSPPVHAAPVQGVTPGAATPRQQQIKKMPTMNKVSESLYQALGDLAPHLREFLNANGGEDVVPTPQIIEEVAEQGKERVRQAQQVARRENRPAPITKLPVFGQRSNLPPQKDYRLEYFRGEADLKGKRDPMQCKDWLEAVGRLVTTYALTENAAIEMLQLHARRAAADTISEAIAVVGNASFALRDVLSMYVICKSPSAEEGRQSAIVDSLEPELGAHA